MERTYKFTTYNKAKTIEATVLPIKETTIDHHNLEFEIKFDGETYKGSWTPDNTLKHKDLPFGYTLHCSKGTCTKTDQGLSDWIAGWIEQTKKEIADRKAERKKNYRTVAISYYDDMIGGLNVDKVAIDMRNIDSEVKRLAEIFKRTEDLVRKEIDEQIGKVEKADAERKEKYDAALKLAKETGKRQVLSSWMDEQEHVQYVMPDGSIKTETCES